MSQTTNRRTFLRECFLLTIGAGAGVTVSKLLREQRIGRAFADDRSQAPGYDQRLRELGLELPEPSKPVAVYVPAVVTGNLLFTAGHIPRAADGQILKGRIGADFTLEQGADAARNVAMHILSTVRQTIGTLDRVVRLVKVTGMVNCTTDFTQQSQVVNGFSELMIDVFGDDAGKAARSAVGMGSLPLGVPVEIEAVFEIIPQPS